MEPSELPGSPGAVFTQPSDEREPLVTLEIDRRAAQLDGLDTDTCLMCGAVRAETSAEIHVAGRFSSIPIRASVCRACLAKADEAYAKVGRLNGVVRTIYFAQLAALGVTLATGAGALIFSALSTLLVGTIGGSYFARKRALRDMPRLLKTGATSVTVRVPRSWGRVLADERPRVLVGKPEPQAITPPGSASPG